MRYLRYILTAVLIALAIFVIYSKFKGSYYDIPLLFKEANKKLLWALVFFQCLIYFSDGWLSRTLLRIAGFDINLRDTMTVAILGVLGGQFAPLIGGTLITYYFYKKLKIPSGAILFLVTSWTLLIWLSYFFFFLSSLFFLSKPYFLLIPSKVILLVLTLTVIVLILIFLLFKNQGRGFVSFLDFFVKPINKLGKRIKKGNLINPGNPKNFVDDLYKSFGLLAANKKKIPQVLLASLLFYFGNIASLYFCFLVFGFHPPLAVLIFGFTISLILTVFTLMPETPGVMEASLAVVFLNLGFPPHIALFSSLLFRIFSYWLPLPLGIFSYFRLKGRNKVLE
jgi:uncharacterized protein (TIRG00374 family)